jgi:hypothetical protein
MKRRSFLSFLFLLAVCFSACDKDTCDCDNGNENTEPNVVNEYYVKYVISCSYPRVFSNWSVTTPQGNYTRNDYQTRRWEQTYGPVKKGFRCGVQVGRGEPTIEIYVSKNSEPFALKRTTIGQSASIQ